MVQHLPSNTVQTSTHLALNVLVRCGAVRCVALPCDAAQHRTATQRTVSAVSKNLEFALSAFRQARVVLRVYAAAASYALRLPGGGSGVPLSTCTDNRFQQSLIWLASG